MIRGIPAGDYTDDVRERVRPFLENFAKRDLDGTTVEDFELDILNQDMQLWIINDYQAVVMTRVTRNAVRIERCAGIRRHEWQDEIDSEMEAWGRALGKKYIIGTVRPGWYPYAKTKGYREAHRELVRGI